MDFADSNEFDDSMEDDVILLSDEFSLAKDKIPLLEENKDRIEDLFDVEIDYGLTAMEGQMQWVTVSGEDENRAKARDYVRALCNPEDTMSMSYPPALHPFLSRAHVHEKLEKQSRAVILFPAIGTAVIQGNDALAVTLALSSVEDLITKYENEQTPNPDTVRSPSTKKASLRLESELRRLSSENHSIEYDEDYSRMPDAVKRTMLVWLQENTQAEGLGTMADLQEAAEEISETIPLRIRGSNHTRNVISHSVSDDPATDPSMQKYWDLGHQKGYSDKDISSVLRVFGSQLDNDDFVLALETHTGIPRKDDDGDGLDAVSKNPMEEVLNEQTPNVTKKNTGKKKSPRKRNKPKEGSTDAYLQLLTRDFAEEDREMDIDGLKERSAQRIQLLHQALDMEPVITDVRINHKDNDTDDQNEDGIAVDDRDDTDWKVVPDHKRGRRGGRMPYNKHKTFNEPNSQQNYGNYQESQVAQLDDFGDYRQHNHLDFSPRRGGNLSPHRHQSPSRQNRGMRGKSPSRQSPARPPSGHLRQGRNSPSRRGSPPQYSSQPPPQFKLDSRNAGGFSSLPLRYIIIDGSNVAMSHSNGRCFSCRGIQICVDYFLKKGHQEITVFVPQWRTQAPKPGYEIEDQHILLDLKHKGHLVFTPARRVPGKNIVCYDDRFIIKLAIETDGIIVSNDNYRDLWWENVDYRNIIENRLLPYSFVGDFFMPPDDPLGRDGPHLSQFLTKMDEDNYRSVNDRAMSSNQRRGWQHGRGRGGMNYPPQPGGANYQMPPPGGMNYQLQPINRGRGILPTPTNQMGRGLLPTPTNQVARGRGASLRQMAPHAFQNLANQFNSGQQTSTQTQKSPSKQPNRKWLRAQLLSVFPDNEDVVDQVLQRHSKEHNLNKLSFFILEILGVK